MIEIKFTIDYQEGDNGGLQSSIRATGQGNAYQTALAYLSVSMLRKFAILEDDTLRETLIMTARAIQDGMITSKDLMDLGDGTIKKVEI